MTERLPTLPERAAVKAALRECLSVRQIKALLDGGWKQLVGDAKAEADALRDQLEDIKRSLGS